jgi:hypothetical protein
VSARLLSFCYFRKPQQLSRSRVLYCRALDCRLLQQQRDRSLFLLATDWGTSRSGIRVHFALSDSETDNTFASIVDRRNRLLTELKITACMEYLKELGDKVHVRLESAEADGSSVVVDVDRVVAALRWALSPSKERSAASDADVAKHTSIANAFREACTVNDVREFSRIKIACSER